MELPVANELELYAKAVELASELKQDVFDALYHAVALLRTDTQLITADERYYRIAKRIGRIIRLHDLALQ